MSIENIVVTIILLIVVIAILYIISIWIYKRAPANMGFIRTGFLGTMVCLGRGAIVLPVFHEVTWISLETIKLIVSRARDQAILTADKIRIDVVAELYAHVGHNTEDLLAAARSLGEKTFDPEKVRILLEAKIVSALRSYAATKTLSELHENRDTFASAIKSNVVDSFRANGLALEEVTIVTLEQTDKEYFDADNVYDAQGLKVITEITSDARRRVHETEKRTTVSLRQKDLDTQMELLEIERQEAFARALQDKQISNEQALQIGEKQIYVLDQRMAVEQKEIETEKKLERERAARDVNAIEEGQRREAADIKKALVLEQERRDREIALITKSKEEEVAEIARALAREQAEEDKRIELIGKEKEREQADIDRTTAVGAHEQAARDRRHQSAEQATRSMHKRSLETKLELLGHDKDEAFASARQEQEVANERAAILSEQQRFILEQRWQVEEEEINKALALERAKIKKDVEVVDETRKREAAEIRRALAREQEERDRDIALVAKAEELERAEIQRQLARESEERDRDVSLVGKDEALERARVAKVLAVELEEREREIRLIGKDQERERADIQRFLARELEERDREIAMAAKTRELEQAEAKRLQMTTERERAEHEADSVRILADADRNKVIERVHAEAEAEVRRIEEQAKAEISSMHMLTLADARERSAEKEAVATLSRARANSEAQQVSAHGIEREAGAVGRAEMEIENLRVENTQRRFHAEATGIEAKAGALKKYNESAAFLELSKLRIEADRDVHSDQAKAMGSALSGAQIRMYGDDNGTVTTLRRLFTSGFGIGETLEGVAESLPSGLRQRLSEDGLRGLFRGSNGPEDLRQSVAALTELVGQNLGPRKSKQVSFAEGLALLEEKAGEDEAQRKAIAALRDVNQGLFDDAPFDKAWALLQAATQTEAS